MYLIKIKLINKFFSNDGSTTIGITSLGRVFHMHCSETSAYTVRVYPKTEGKEGLEDSDSKSRSDSEAEDSFKADKIRKKSVTKER